MDKLKQVSSVYDKVAEFYANAFSEPSEHIDDFLDLIPNGAKVIDIGCGVGVDVGYMVSKGFKVIGTDFSEGMLNLARQKFSHVDFRKQDIRSLNFSDNSFDGALASMSLIHIPKKDILELLKSLYQILKKDGVIYIGLQGGRSEEVFVDESFNSSEKIFINVFSFDEIKSLHIKTGFSIVKKYERKPRERGEFNYTKLYIIAKKNKLSS